MSVDGTSEERHDEDKFFSYIPRKNLKVIDASSSSDINSATFKKTPDSGARLRPIPMTR